MTKEQLELLLEYIDQSMSVLKEDLLQRDSWHVQRYADRARNKLFETIQEESNNGEEA